MAGYTVIDLETTGLSARSHDRVVEIGVVYVSHRGQVEGSWSTLVNPQRDVGPTRIHGITASDVVGAPTFAQVAPLVLESVAGRTLVAHNARFDLTFLGAELRRSGVPLGAQPIPSVCTMEWARTFVAASSRSLGDLCAACGVDLNNAHSAAGDALATAGLLAHYLARSGFSPPWRDTLAQARAYPWPVYKGGRPRVQLVGRDPGARRVVPAPEPLPVAFGLTVGDRVAFTGEMRRTRQEWEDAAQRAGLVVDDVTMGTKVLVAADPNTQSRKAERARWNRIPIITEDAFVRLLAGGVGVRTR